ncbi:MAG TPA: S6e family ribosomal protein [Candidatus Nanoarchaeia archaeon]|nr:S6e family ribosomal protein [Candidatus Nanoarchaeia archaeon]
MEIKLVMSDKTGKSYQKAVGDTESKKLVGLKIGDRVKGEIFDLTGYEFEITGGSDNAGFPMRRDVAGIARKKIAIVKGVGLKKPKKRWGMKLKKTVSGNTINAKTAQVNLKVIKAGAVPLVAEQKEEKKE